MVKAVWVASLLAVMAISRMADLETVPSLKTPGQRSTRPRQFVLLAPKLWNKLPVAFRTAVLTPWLLPWSEDLPLQTPHVS